jgi:hypothetical protein
MLIHISAHCICTLHMDERRCGVFVQKPKKISQKREARKEKEKGQINRNQEDADAAQLTTHNRREPPSCDDL